MTTQKTTDELIAVDETGLDIVDRLRGKVRVPINDGLGRVTPDGGDNFFERSFPTSRLANIAADYIEAFRKETADRLAELEAENKRLLGLVSDCMSLDVSVWQPIDTAPKVLGQKLLFLIDGNGDWPWINSAAWMVMSDGKRDWDFTVKPVNATHWAYPPKMPQALQHKEAKYA